MAITIGSGSRNFFLKAQITAAIAMGTTLVLLILLLGYLRDQTTITNNQFFLGVFSVIAATGIATAIVDRILKKKKRQTDIPSPPFS